MSLKEEVLKQLREMDAYMIGPEPIEAIKDRNPFLYNVIKEYKYQAFDAVKKAGRPIEMTFEDWVND